MSQQRTILKNVIWNWTGLGTNIIGMFVLFPFLVSRLGQSLYGVWALIAALTGYLAVFDFGLRSSMARNIAFYQAKGDQDQVNAVVSTGLAMLLRGAVIVVVLSFAAIPVFFAFFAKVVEGVDSTHVGMSIVLIGINLALLFPMSVFEGFLGAKQRFGLINAIDIPHVILRVVFAVWLATPDSASLVVLGLVLVGATLFRLILFVFVTFTVDPNLQVRWKFVNKKTSNELFHFGIWCFVMSTAYAVRAQMGPFFIGNQIGKSNLIPRYVSSNRVVQTVEKVLAVSSGVLTPLATKLYASEQKAQQQKLFVYGGLVCMTLGAFFFGALLYLGGPFFRLWIRTDPGEAPAYDSWLLVILMIGELIPFSQWVTYSTVIGMNRHKLWAVMAILEVGSIVGLAWFLLPPYGLYGLCVAIAFAGAIFRGIVPMLYGCAILHVRFDHYFFQAMLPPVLATTIPTVILWRMTTWHTPATWLELVGYGLIYAGCFGATLVMFVFGPRRSISLIRRVLRRESNELEQDAKETKPSSLDDSLGGGSAALLLGKPDASEGISHQTSESSR
ncbi:MAG: lipopolysaccharide biosynthesis protein [Gemmataceae bacterium]